MRRDGSGNGLVYFAGFVGFLATACVVLGQAMQPKAALLAATVIAILSIGSSFRAPLDLLGPRSKYWLQSAIAQAMAGCVVTPLFLYDVSNVWIHLTIPLFLVFVAIEDRSRFEHPGYGASAIALGCAVSILFPYFRAEDAGGGAFLFLFSGLASHGRAAIHWPALGVELAAFAGVGGYLVKRAARREVPEKVGLGIPQER